MTIRPSFHHVNLKTTRLPEMIDWYARMIGTEVTFRFPGGAWLTNDASHHRIALTSLEAFRDDPDKDVHSGIHHTAFEYGSLDELLATYTRVRDEYGELPAICRDHGMTLAFYYADPDGNRLELQYDWFEDWAQSTRFMQSSPRFAADPLGPEVDPERILAHRARGEAPPHIHELAYAGELAPATPGRSLARAVSARPG